jgi:hypothetical protein
MNKLPRESRCVPNLGSVMDMHAQPRWSALQRAARYSSTHPLRNTPAPPSRPSRVVAAEMLQTCQPDNNCDNTLWLLNRFVTLFSSSLRVAVAITFASSLVVIPLEATPPNWWDAAKERYEYHEIRIACSTLAKIPFSIRIMTF